MCKKGLVNSTNDGKSESYLKGKSRKIYKYFCPLSRYQSQSIAFAYYKLQTKNKIPPELQGTQKILE